MSIQSLADAYADAVVSLKFARIDKLAVRSTATAQEILSATTGVINANNAVKSTRKALLDEATKDVKERLGWLAKVDPNQLPLPLHLGCALNGDDDKFEISNEVYAKEMIEDFSQKKIQSEIADIVF